MKFIRRYPYYSKVSKDSTYSQNDLEMSATSKEEIESKLKKMGDVVKD